MRNDQVISEPTDCVVWLVNMISWQNRWDSSALFRCKHGTWNQGAPANERKKTGRRAKGAIFLQIAGSRLALQNLNQVPGSALNIKHFQTCRISPKVPKMTALT